MGRPGRIKQLVAKPGLSMQGAISAANAVAATSANTPQTAQTTGGPNRLAYMANGRTSEGRAPLGNKLAPLPLPPE